MVNPYELTQWIIGACLVLATPALAMCLYDRRDSIARALERYANRMSARGEEEPQDPFVEDLMKALRRERLQADFDRLRHLITVDQSMSATRQIANRLAYRQVRQECAAEFGPTRLDRTSRGWVDPYRAAPSYQRVTVAEDERGYRPRVETLEIRWR